MKIYVVFAHPSTQSFTREVLDEFLRGLQDAGHSIEIGDLYQMNFKADMDLEQYTRETGTDPDAPLTADVLHEHAKITAADSTSKIEILKALVICPAGHPLDHLEETGIAESMRRVMLNDRLLGVGVKKAQMEILGGMINNDPDVRKQNLETAYQLGLNF